MYFDVHWTTNLYTCTSHREKVDIVLVKLVEQRPCPASILTEPAYYTIIKNRIKDQILNNRLKVGWRSMNLRKNYYYSEKTSKRTTVLTPWSLELLSSQIVSSLPNIQCWGTITRGLRTRRDLTIELWLYHWRGYLKLATHDALAPCVADPIITFIFRLTFLGFKE